MATVNEEKVNRILDIVRAALLSREDLLSLLQDTAEGCSALDKKPKKDKIVFNKKDIDKMPSQFKKIFRTDGYTARIYKRKTSLHGISYDIRFRREGYNINVTARTIEEVKNKFIEALKTAVPAPKKEKGIPITFNAFAMYYFEKFRIKKVAKITYECDMRRYNNHLKPYFGEKSLRKITALECQDLLDKHTALGQNKTASELYSLMSIIFKAAIAHGIISKNPLAIVFHQKHESEHGTAFTKEEEKMLLEKTIGTPYHLMFAVALYTGMRPNEYETARIEGDFIVCKNSKRKNGKIEYKKIPISPMLKPYLENVIELNFYAPPAIREKMRELMPGHIPYDLRTTFYTRCIECGVSETARKLFVGHSLGDLGNAYTDVSDEFLLKEGAKLKY